MQRFPLSDLVFLFFSSFFSEDSLSKKTLFIADPNPQEKWLQPTQMRFSYIFFCQGWIKDTLASSCYWLLSLWSIIAKNWETILIYKCSDLDPSNFIFSSRKNLFYLLQFLERKWLLLLQRFIEVFLFHAVIFQIHTFYRPNQLWTPQQNISYTFLPARSPGF